ncbi:unnamed protein product [Rotaria sp. Silwood2]|nr:unnamed protein product [Rotaria sp. Silwood2]
MFNAIPEGSSSSQDSEYDQLIGQTDEHINVDDQSSSHTSSPQSKTKKTEGIKWKRHTFDSIDLPESTLKPIPYFVNLSRKTPLDVFEYFMDITLLLKIATESNKYKDQKGYQIPDISEEEIQKFIVVLVYMSIIRLPRRRMYWSKSTKQTIISSVFTRNRFEEILLILHFNDNQNEPSKTDISYDRLFKIRPLINHFNRKFQSAVVPEEINSINEKIIPHKGSSSLKRYLSSKPHKWGYKIYSRTGKSSYLYQFEIEGDNQTTTVHPDVGAASNVVIRLTQNIPPNSFVCYDNYFATMKLMKFLHDKQYHVISTIRVNRFNSSLLKSDKKLKQEGKGSFDFQTADDDHFVITK